MLDAQAHSPQDAQLLANLDTSHRLHAPSLQPHNHRTTLCVALKNSAQTLCRIRPPIKCCFWQSHLGVRHYSVTTNCPQTVANKRNATPPHTYYNIPQSWYPHSWSCTQAVPTLAHAHTHLTTTNHTHTHPLLPRGVLAACCRTLLYHLRPDRFFCHSSNIISTDAHQRCMMAPTSPWLPPCFRCCFTAAPAPAVTATLGA